MPQVDEELKEVHVSQKLSTYEISKRTGIPVATVGYRLKRMGVLRTRSEAMSVHMKRQMTIWFTCLTCGKKKPLSELVQDRRFVPFPRSCCKECAGY